MGYRIFKLYYFVLYKRQNNVYFLQNMSPKNIHIYTPSFFLQSLTLELQKKKKKLKFTTFLSPPASDSKGDSFHLYCTHVKKKPQTIFMFSHLS